MNISKKIERIRQQPEHVRLKYVWLSVAACMLVVILVWILSTKAAFQKDDVSQNFTQLKESFATDSVQMPSISDLPETEGILEQQDYSIDEKQQYQPSLSQQKAVPVQETYEQNNPSNTLKEPTHESSAPKEIPTFPTE
jgi:hypothetical protein